MIWEAGNWKLTPVGLHMGLVGNILAVNILGFYALILRVINSVILAPECSYSVKKKFLYADWHSIYYYKEMQTGNYASDITDLLSLLHIQHITNF